MYKPPEDHLNCDPSLELEEMIVEAKPLHKKKKRLAKQRSSAKENDIEQNLVKEFIVYNRYNELKKRAMELKEKEWQEELNTLMANSEVNNLCIRAGKEVVAGTSAGASNIDTGTKLANDRTTNESIEFIDRTPSPKPNLVQ